MRERIHKRLPVEFVKEVLEVFRSQSRKIDRKSRNKDIENEAESKICKKNKRRNRGVISSESFVSLILVLASCRFTVFFFKKFSIPSFGSNIFYFLLIFT